MLSGIEVLTDKIRMDSTYLVILVKLIGIAYICEFAASISKDAGYSAVASQIELLGKLTMLVVSLPVFMQDVYKRQAKDRMRLSLVVGSVAGVLLIIILI